MRLSVIGSLLSGLLLFPSANSVGESFETAIVSESAQGGQSVKLESQTASSESKLGEIKSLIQAAIKDSPQPLSGSVILLERGKPLLDRPFAGWLAQTRSQSRAPQPRWPEAGWDPIVLPMSGSFALQNSFCD